MRLGVKRDKRAKKLSGVIKRSKVNDLQAAIQAYLEANREVGDFELAHYSTLAEHQFIGVSVTEQNIVVREPPLAGTNFNHDWAKSEITWQGQPLYIRQCRNCSITYFKVGGDPDSNDGWVKSLP